MTMSIDLEQLSTALRRSAVRATLAPSVHNTQPWRFRLSQDELEISADSSRQLRVLDPTGRQLTISCGCALFNARVSLAGSGFSVRVDRFPELSSPEVLARLSVSQSGAGSAEPLAALDSVLELRRTNRRQFVDEPVPSDLIEDLQRAAEREDSILFPIRGEDHRLATAILSQRADAIQNVNPAYRAELRAWTTSDLTRGDGVPASAVPHVDGASHDDVPLRDFDTSGAGMLPAHGRAARHQCLLLLGTRRDDPVGWLRAGEALERIQLEVARHGFAISPLTQVVEVVSTRAQLRAELGLSMWPHVLLRVGRAPATPATRRRRLVDVLSEVPGVGE